MRAFRYSSAPDVLGSFPGNLCIAFMLPYGRRDCAQPCRRTIGMDSPTSASVESSQTEARRR
jgi:hypothetical protein